MATRSTVPTARATLLAALQAKPALAQIQVAYQHPGDAREADSIYLGEVRRDSSIPTLRAGRKTREERFTIDVWVDCAGDGPTAQTASERAWGYVGELEDILADDPSLGLTAPFRVVGTSGDENLFFDEARRGFGSLIRVGVECETRLT